MYFLHVAFSVLLWLQVLLPKVLALKGDSGCNWFMCVNATLHEDDMITYEITGVYQPLGWLALGWGRKMDHTHMAIIWPNDDGTVTLSQRYGRGHHEPALIANVPRVATLVEPVPSSWNPPNSTRMAFKIPANKTALAENPVERLIWAYSMTRPEKSDDAVLLPHYRSGFLRVNFSKEAIPPPPPTDKQMTLPTAQETTDNTGMVSHHHHDMPPPPPSSSDSSSSDAATKPASEDSVTFATTESVAGPWGNHEKLITAHGVLLVFGFLLLLPSGSLIARWGRTFTPKWFKAHSFINMSIAMPVILIGWLLGPMAVVEHQAAHLVTTHQICGVFLVILYLLQVWLGRYIHRRRANGLVPANRPHPPSNILHVVMGILVMTLAFFQVRSGLDEWETATGRGPLHMWCHDLWLAWTVIVPLAYLTGLALVPRQFYLERSNIMPGGGVNYISLADGAESPLLFDGSRDRDENGIYSESGGRYKNTQASMDSVRVTAEVEK